MHPDVSNALAYLHRCAIDNAKNRGINVLSSEVVDPDGMPLSVTIEFPDLGWRCECDRVSMVVHWQGEQRVFPWESFDSEAADLDAEFGQRVLYHEPTTIFTHAMLSSGPWAQLTAPGLFFLWVWNAGYRVKRIPGASQE